MRNRNTAVFGLTIVAFAIAGGCADTPPTEPPIEVSLTQHTFQNLLRSVADGGETRDHHLAQLVRDVPGFGGFYLGEDGQMNVVMATAAQPLSAQALSVLGDHLDAMGIDMAGQPITVVEGKYDFAQLHAWHQALSPLLSMPGVVFTDADERANRVTVAVADLGAAHAVEQVALMAGVPAAALNVRKAEPFHAVPLAESADPMSSHTVRDFRRPVAGGLQVSYPGFICTHGFGIRPRATPAGPDFWVTMGACTDGVGTPFWQPLSGIPFNFIGETVFAEPPGFAAWMAAQNYAARVPNAFGQIYRTTGILSLNVDPANPRWAIVRELPYPPIGTVVHKTGRTTGWTQGFVTQNCVNVPIAGTPIVFFCQDIAMGSPPIVAPGDQGAASFVRIGMTNSVEHTGMIWGASGDGSTWVQSSNDMIRIVYGTGYIICPTC